MLNLFIEVCLFIPFLFLWLIASKSAQYKFRPHTYIASMNTSYTDPQNQISNSFLTSPGTFYLHPIFYIQLNKLWLGAKIELTKCESGN